MVDRDTDAGIQGAIVSVDYYSSDPTVKDTTDANGFGQIYNLLPGNYYALCWIDQWAYDNKKKSGDADILISSGKTTFISFVLKREYGNLEYTVLDGRTNQPIQGAKVECRGKESFSNEAGYGIIRSILVGNHIARCYLGEELKYEYIVISPDTTTSVLFLMKI